MKFFFPDSLDLVDPSFDFITETRSPHRFRQRDDLYPHELFAEMPYDGILVSKAIVDGTSDGASGKYSIPQRQRLLRMGVREFFRLDASPKTAHLKSMGDCGAFTYVRQEVPPYSVTEVIDFYEACGFDYGVSVDHVILGYRSEAQSILPGMYPEIDQWKQRQEITLNMASDFIAMHRMRSCRFIPVGVAQGWSPCSYRFSVEQLQRLGYEHLALGGLVPLKSHEILEVLTAVRPALRAGVQVHLFGVTRCDYIGRFQEFGVTSFDSTSPLRQAFKDDKNNYYTPDRTYTAIRVPQVDGNAKLKRRILSGEVDQNIARRLERDCLDALNGYDRGEIALEVTLDALISYERLHDGKTDRTDLYRGILLDRPWKKCPCEICRDLGIHVILFRGAERNRRRGFHNLWVFYRSMQKELTSTAMAIS